MRLTSPKRSGGIVEKRLQLWRMSKQRQALARSSVSQIEEATLRLVEEEDDTLRFA